VSVINQQSAKNCVQSSDQTVFTLLLLKNSAKSWHTPRVRKRQMTRSNVNRP